MFQEGEREADKRRVARGGRRLDPNSLLPAKLPLRGPGAPDLLIICGRRMAAAELSKYWSSPVCLPSPVPLRPLPLPSVPFGPLPLPSVPFGPLPSPSVSFRLRSLETSARSKRATSLSVSADIIKTLHLSTFCVINVRPSSIPSTTRCIYQWKSACWCACTCVRDAAGLITSRPRPSINPGSDSGPRQLHYQPNARAFMQPLCLLRTCALTCATLLCPQIVFFVRGGIGRRKMPSKGVGLLGGIKPSRPNQTSYCRLGSIVGGGGGSHLGAHLFVWHRSHTVERPAQKWTFYP